VAGSAEMESFVAKESRINLRYPRHWDDMFRAMKKVVHGTWGTARATGGGMK